MLARLCLLGLVAGCYAPRVQSGAPCDPALANCPEDQTCALVAGSYVCVEGPPPGADAGGADATVDGSFADASAAGDAGTLDAAFAPWTLIQTVGSTTPVATIAASGADDLIVVAVETSSTDPVVAIADDAGNTYVPILAARAANATINRGIDVWYAPKTKAGATTIMVAAPVHYATVVWEVAGIRTTTPLDTATKLDDRPASSTPVGASITTNQAGEFVVSVAVVSHIISGIRDGNEFTNDLTTFGNGWAHLTDPAAPAGSHQAQWNQPTAGEYCSSSAAFFVGP